MKLIVMLLTVACLQVQAKSSAQQVTLQQNQVSIGKVFEQIYKQTGYQFICTKAMLEDALKVSIHVKDAPLKDVLEMCFKGQLLDYTVKDSAIIVKRKKESELTTIPSIELKGKVVDEVTGEPLVGVTIQVKGTSRGTVTDANGQFSMSVPEYATLVVSYLGFATKEVPVNGRTNLSVSLTSAATGLDQLVVVGYGTQKRNTITSAISTIGKEEIDERPVVDLTSILQGNVAGLNFSTSATESSPVGGEPGHEIQFNIRGIGSINGGKPYVLVDGIEQSLQNVNPADVESITVLKDASASAIYGARAAYGVVLVTTKDGQKGKPRITYQGSVGFSSPINMPQMMPSVTFAHYINERNDNMGNKHIFSEETIEKMKEFNQNPYTPGLPGLGLNPDGSNWGSAYDNQYANTNWFDYYFKDHALLNIHNLSISGGGKNTEYYVGAGYTNQEGLLNKVTDALHKLNLNTKIEVRANKRLKFNVNNNLTYQKINRPMPNQTIFYGIMGNSYPNRPTHLPVKSAYDLPTWNELMYLENAFYERKRISDALLLSATIEVMKNWEVKGDMKIRYNVENNSFTLKKPRYEKANGMIEVIEGNKQGYQYPGMRWQNTQFGSYTRGSAYNLYLSPNLYSNYTYETNRHFFKAMVGFQAEKQTYSSDYVYKDGMMSEDVYSFANANGKLFAGENRTHWSTLGFFARINYNYKNTYFFEFSGRYDGSSRFAPGHRWGLFPSVSVGYDIARTDYFTELRSIFSQLKVRASYGRLGNQNGAGLYDYVSSIPLNPNDPNGWLLPGVGVGPNRGTLAYTPAMVSPYITWEKVDNANIGLDVTAFDNRLTVVANVYQRTTRDMIGPAEAIPSIAGIPSGQRSKVNNATLRNRGWELSVNWSDKTASGLSYGIGLNLFNYKAEVTQYNNPEGIIYNNHTGLARNKGYYPGMAVGEIWGYKADELFHSNPEVDAYLSKVDLSYFKANSAWQAGDLKYEDINGDGKVDPGEGTLDNHGDLMVIGNTIPKYSFGFNLMLGYKNIELTTFFQGVGERDFPMAGSTYLFGGRNYFKEHLDYFRYDNPDAYLPRLTDPKQTDYEVNTGYNTTRYLLNAAYFRMKNISLSYTFDNNILKYIGLENLKVYVSADNLFTVSSLPDQFDPETINQVNTWAGGSNKQAPGLTSILLQNGNGKVYPLNKRIVFGINVTF